MKIGLALGGGGARGIAHIVVLEVLDDLGVDVHAISGSSIGALIGMGYAAGMTGVEVREHATKTFTRRLDVASKLWGLRPSTLNEWFSRKSYAVGQVDAAQILSQFTPVDDLVENLEDLPLPLTVLATDYYRGVDIPIRSGNLKQAVAASIAIPMIFKPVVFEGRVAIDGGVSNPVPFDHLPSDCDAVIAVDVTGAPQPKDSSGPQVPGAIETIIGSAQISMKTIIEAKKLTVRAPDLVIEPPISDFQILDFLKTEAVLEAAEPMRESVSRQIQDLIEATTSTE